MTSIKRMVSGQEASAFSVSIVLIVAATVFKLLVIPSLGSEAPFLLYFALVLVVARYGSTASAVFSTVASALTANYFFVSPVFSFATNAEGLIQTAFFLIESGFCIWICRNLATAVERVKKTDAKIKSLMANTVEVIATSNGKGEITFVNDAIKNVLGYTVEEYLKLKPWTLLHPDELDELRQKFDNCISQEKSSFSLRHRIKNKAGEFIWVDSHVSNLRHIPEINGMVNNFRDVSKEVLFDEYREGFIGIVSHELKTPISTIKGYLQIILRSAGKKGDTELSTFASKTLDQTDRLTKIVTDLLNVSAINEGVLTLDRTSFSFEDVLTAALENTSAANSLDVKIIGDPDVLITADKSKLQQVLTNLISNAIKFSPENKSLEIGVNVIRDSFLEVRVRDYGVGIPQKSMEYIFKKFYRVSPSNANFQGHGLGLFIAREIILAHNGDIEVKSQEGKGSEFSFKIPIS